MAKPLKPGQLNPLNFSLKTPIATPDKIIDNPMAVYNQSIANLMNANLFDGVTQYKAQVLLSFDNEEEDNSFWQLIRSSLPDSLAEHIPPQSKFCVCRIPEIHQAFVDPNLYQDGDPKKIKAILRHPVFEANLINLGVKGQIGPGSIVNVSFFDPLLRTGEVTGIVFDSGEPNTITSNSTARSTVESNPAINRVTRVEQAQIDADAEVFDNPSLQEQPLPVISERGQAFIDGLNPDFQKIIKSFILRCWEQLAIEIIPSSGFRSAKTQREMRKTWEASDQTTPAPAKGISFHNAGLAFDFNPRLPSGKTLTSTGSTKQEWVDSGIGDIISQLGLKWGILFRNNYDPIHVDMSPALGWVGKDVGKFIDASETFGTPVTSWPVYEYIVDPTRPPSSVASSASAANTRASRDTDVMVSARTSPQPE